MSVTLVMVTHNESLVDDAADRIYTFLVEKRGRDHTVSTVQEREKID